MLNRSRAKESPPRLQSQRSVDRRLSHFDELPQHRQARRRVIAFALSFVFLVAAAIRLPAQPIAGDVAQDTPADSAAAIDGTTPLTPANTAAGRPRTEPQKSAVPRDPYEIVAALGLPFVIPFAFASIIAVWFAIERMVMLRRRRVIPRAFVERFLMHLRGGRMTARQALMHCEENGSPVAHVFAHGIRKWGKPSVEVEQAIIDGGERQVSYLRKHLRVLNGVATVTPLIGLLGTVIGMIQAFNEIASADAMGKAQQLAVGIALALLTTATGLLIAIPSLIMYMYLAGRVDALVMEMDSLAQDVVNLISAETLGVRSARVRKPKPKAVADPTRQESVQ